MDAIQQALLNGMGQRIALTLPTTAFAYDKSWQPYPYDPKKAKALLAEAGYPNGFTVPLLSRQGRYLKDREIMDATIGFLAKVGGKVEAHLVAPGDWEEMSEKKARDGISFPGWGGMRSRYRLVSAAAHRPVSELLCQSGIGQTARRWSLDPGP